MAEKEIYLDNNATTRPYPEVVDAMIEVLGEGFGNPSSTHATGLRAKEFVEKARKETAKLLGCDANKIIFTSSGTESNNMAFYSCFRDCKGPCCIVTSCVEHSSIKKMCSYLKINGAEIIELDACEGGYVNLDELDKMLKNKKVSLVSIQWVNNETGVIQPVEEIGKICRSHGILYHTDAAQAVGKLDLKIKDMPIDYLSLTGHKFNSPQGIGAIYCSDKLNLNPIMFGGFQEDHFRPGTENVPGIVGIGKASEIRRKKLTDNISYMKNLRDGFEEKLSQEIRCVSFNGDTENRVCNTSNVHFKNIDGRILKARLDSVGIRCSQSSACTNSSPDPSYVLLAMGKSPEDAYSSIRFSFSTSNTMEEVERTVAHIKKFCRQLRH
ncbi:MAG: cysteine desulfurase [Candidatus Dadabacteria bacterium]|nr:cysteine desulfurase [Candidatus Dadabacteria bacterium]NIS08064.1 cysteine desulfurase [Candidatus Dadabacteria bacterium]NIV42312.1 aminotransferase class V-fold PLP-dependent enzyme [Candidatus Dadabacteria bacterium]NIX14807.1 aminotransferase class V-fold PLP-dependent enzyme [Candidatus Dadabacteria bacterium]NIY21348.1 aminotransferase class V-fold PLP-dependent enzyme [Candidatus Dadabacteria bacterium]